MQDADSAFSAVPCPQECSSGIPGIGQNQHFIFVPSTRNDYAVLDAAKVADVVCFVMSCKGTDHLNVKLDPDKYCGAIDELGYKHINMLRAQGIPEVAGVLQHLEELPAKKHSLIKKFFQRYFESEFSPKEKFFVINKKDEGGNYVATLKHMLRHFVSLVSKELSWRKHRSYFVVDKCKYVAESELMEVYGYVHGNSFTTRLPVHITGYGTFLLAQIKSEEDPLRSSSKAKKHEELKQGEILEVADPGTQEALVFENPPDPFAAEQTWPTKEELKGAVKLREIAENPKEAMELEAVDSNSEQMESDQEEAMGEEEKEVIDSEEEDKDEDKDEDEEVQPISGKHKKMTTLQERSEQDLEFPDEVDTPVAQEANARFQRYKGLKSIKTTKWDPYENLPVTYSKLFEFKNFTQSRKLAVAFSETHGLKLHGIYTKFSIKGLKPETLAGHPRDVPIVREEITSR